MSTVSVAGALLLALPVTFNVAFGVLAATFDYPDILRRPTHEVLARFREGGTKLMLWWWIFALTAAALAPLAVLVARALDDANGTLVVVGATVGVLAGLVQMLGVIRWPFLVPYLARVDADPDASPGPT
jgi:cytochrome bd-type quinol oxidase subunit 2